jgi:2-polyprenyl-3-methyl-5-hydroxy-6-metoxy-1,4-benzoquinol methylase
VTAATPAATTACIACGSPLSLALSIRFRKDGFAIVRCETCGLMFRAELPTKADLAEIYDSSYFRSGVADTGGQGYRDYVRDEELHREIARRRLERLEHFVPSGRVLDVGAAAGFFVAEAARRGWDARGIDISAEMVQWGRGRLGVELDQQTLAELEAESGSFDVVTMWDYIEHALDPREDLLRARDLLGPSGVIALSTGDAASLTAKVSAGRWHLLTPRHHNYFFTAGSLRLLLRGLGFEVVYEGHPGARYSMRYLAHKLSTIFNVALVRRLADAVGASAVGALKVPLNLGDIVTIIARPG